MSYNNYKPHYSLYQRGPAPLPGQMGQLGSFGPQPQSLYQRRSHSAGAIYRAPHSAGNPSGFARTPHFAENGFVPRNSSSASLSATASMASSISAGVSSYTSPPVSGTAVTPDRYHRQKHTPSLSTHSLPSLTPSIKSSDLDTSSTQTSTSSISSWTDEKDRAELPQIKESAIERASTSDAELMLELADKLTQSEPANQTKLADQAESAQSIAPKAPESPADLAAARSVSTPAPVTPPRTNQRVPHPSQRTSNQAVEEAIAKLSISGAQPPSAEPVCTHRRQSSNDSRTSLVLPSEKRYDSLPRRHTEPENPVKEVKSPYYNGVASRSSPNSLANSLANPKTRTPVRATRPGTLGSAKTGPTVTQNPIRPPSSSSTRVVSGNNNQNSRPSSVYSMSTVHSTTGALTPRHSRAGSQYSQSHPIAYAPVRGEREPKPKFSQKLKGLFRRTSTISDNASISSNISGKSGLSSMSVRSTSSTFSFRSISQSSKKFFKRSSKVEVMEPTFDQVTPSTSPCVGATPSASASAANSTTGSPIGSMTRANAEDTLDVPDTVFPRNLDDVDAVANIRNSVERTASLDRKGSVRSVRSLHKPNDDEKVPNVQEVRVELPAKEDDDIFGQLNTSGVDLALPKHIKKRAVTFASQVMIYDTFASAVYDRRPEPATCNHLTPALAQFIKQELNTVKMNMEVHRDSRAYTHFF